MPEGTVLPDLGRVDVSETVSLSSGIAARYATAMFELAKEADAVPLLERDADALDAALKESPELGALIASPLLSRDDLSRAFGAVVARMGLSPLVANTLALMGSKRRLFVVPQLITQLRSLIATEKGEVVAEVTAAAPLSDAQTAALSVTLRARAGRDVILKTTVDETLIGGLVVKLGSTMIDTSVKAKLAALQNIMKEVG